MGSLNSIMEFSGIDDLSSNELKVLFKRARAKRDSHWGRRISYSRKVFVPLTNYCRDDCGYCTFVKRPGDKGARIMTPDQVMQVVNAGEAVDAKEVLFSLGEKPELRYHEVRAELLALGHTRMVDYLHQMCAQVLRDSSLLPHVNAGTLTESELSLLKPVSGSMGMMLESVSRRLTEKGQSHYGCPDKVPVQRIRTLERAGKLNIPFTTGILIGIGETWQERLETLQTIAEIHNKFGHIQEVIVQNFRAKPGTPMAHHAEPSHNDMCRTLAVARLILPEEISLQAPPNLSHEHLDYIDCGINDWGGISPVTSDHINPECAWPQLDLLTLKVAEKDYELVERLTVYPKYIEDSERYLEPATAARVNLLTSSHDVQLRRTL